MASIISVGDKFSTYASLEDAVKKLGEDTNTVFIRQESNKTKIPTLKETIVYDRVMFGCKQGRERKPEGKGARKQQRSIKLGCSARVRATLKEEGETWSLVVTMANLFHDTHIPCREALSIFPESRKIDNSVSVKALLQCPSVAVRDIVKAVEVEQGRSILPKDVHNLRAKLKGREGSTDPKKVKAILTSICASGGAADFFIEESGEFKLLTLQTAKMREMLDCYPDVLLMDVTFKTNLYQLPLLTIMCVDDNGRGHPVLHSFMSSEEQGMIVQSLEFLKASFDWTKTSCFFVDKDFSEIGALSVVFPEMAIIVCALHSAAAVNKALGKKGLSTQQVETIKSLFFEMCNALTEEEYNRSKSTLMEVCPEHITQYFHANWFDKPDLWAAHKLVGVGKLHETTTNHCELYHQKLKHALTYKMDLCDCLDALLQLDLALFRSSSYQNVRNMFTRPVAYGQDPVLGLIFNDLTPFAANLVYDQYKVMLKVDNSIAFNEGSYTISYNGHDYATSSTMCSCSFFLNFSLPCRHIFSLRHHLSLTLYQAVPAGHRFKSHVLDISKQISRQVSSSIFSSFQQSRTPEDKYNASEQVCKRICSFMSHLGDSDFSNKLTQLESLFDSWTSSFPGGIDSSSCPFTSEPDSQGIAPPVLPVASVFQDSNVDVDAVATVDASAAVSSHFDELPLSSSSHSTTAVVPSFSQVASDPVRVKGSLENRQNFTGHKRKANAL